MKRVFIALLFFSLSPAIAMTGGEQGNGADAVVCKDLTSGEIISTRLLDSFEASKRGLTPMPANPGETHLQLALRILQQLRGHIPERKFNLLTTIHADFWSRIEWAPKGLGEYETEDTGLIDLPDGCLPKQLVVQPGSVLVSPFKYEIDQPLWEKLSLEDQAATIVHEVLYRAAVIALNGRAAKVSTGIRFVTGELSAAHLFKSTLRNRLIAFGLAEFSPLLVQGVYVTGAPRTVRFSDSGTLLMARVGEASKLNYLGADWIIANDSNIRFFENGAPRCLTPYGESYISRERYKVLIHGITWARPPYETCFHPNGEVRSGYASPGSTELGNQTELHFRNVSGQLEQFSSPSGFSFELDPEGVLLSIGHGYFKHRYRNQTFELSGAEFAPEGGIKRIWLYTSPAAYIIPREDFQVGVRKLVLSSASVNASVRKRRGIEFYLPSQNVRSAYLVKDYELPLASGGNRKFKTGQWVEFDEQGRVIGEEK